MIKIVEVQKKDLNEFIKIPLTLFSKDPFFVPQLNSEMKVHFSGKNPFFNHAEAKYFIAQKNGQTAGRIIAFVNKRHNEFHNEKIGFFGFFECINDSLAANELFSSASEYLRGKGMLKMRGPMNFSTNEECGFLLEGFNEPPIIMMPYNPPYYNDFSVNYGMEKVKDLYAYIHEFQDKLPDQVMRVAAIAEKKGITARTINMKKFKSEMMIFRRVYHSAWEKNWGFIPMTDEELDYAAGRLKQIIIPEITIIAEKEGEPVGFMGIIPDFNYVLKKLNAKLNPISIVRALYHSKKIKDLRVLLIGVKTGFRNRGVEALMFRKAFPSIKKRNYKRVEFSWILEDNIPVQRTIETIGGELYKKYRIYEKAL